MRPSLLSLFIRPHLRVSGMIYTFSSLLLKLLLDVYKRQALYTPPVKPWEPGVPEVRNREDRPRVKLVTGAKS